MRLTSPAFQEGGEIPQKYTCEGLDISPPLRIENPPSEALSLVLIMEDPDVPKSLREDGLYDHWVIFNIPPDTQMLVERATPPGIEGKNTSDTQGYVGPCPPDREHRYFFRLYALDTLLDLLPGASRQKVEQKMASHIIASCHLMGRYQKQQE